MSIPLPDSKGYPGNLGLLFEEHANEDRPALIDLRDKQEGNVVTYRELDTACNAVARGLTKKGLTPGDRIGILSLNRPEFISTLLGAMRAGVIPVPINIKLPEQTISYIIKDANIKLLFAETRFREVFPRNIQAIEFDSSFDGFLDFGSFKAFNPTPDSIAVQPYTSGSTGQPKGVLLTHYGQNWSRRILSHTRGTSKKDVILVAAPLYHKNALNAVKQGLTAGATLPLLPQFSEERYIKAIGEQRCTVISGVPTMISMVLNSKDLLSSTETSSVRTVMMGSAPSSPQLLSEIKEQFPSAEALVVYGVTEGGPVPLGPHPEGKPRPNGSIGAPYAGTEAKLIGGPTPYQGELVVKNPGVLFSYHNLPDETKRSIENGWYRTGDICRCDKDGFFYFLGRTDDMFVCGGENIYPIEVETLLEQHPKVHQVLVMPFEHELKGHVPYAFIIPRKKTQVSEEEIKQFALANGPPYMHPRRVFFIKNLPLTGTNKVNHELLRKWVAKKTLDTPLNTNELKAIK